MSIYEYNEKSYFRSFDNEKSYDNVILVVKVHTYSNSLIFLLYYENIEHLCQILYHFQEARVQLLSYFFFILRSSALIVMK